MAKVLSTLRVYLESPGDDEKAVFTFRKVKVSEKVADDKEFEALETESEKLKHILKLLMARCIKVEGLYDEETGAPVDLKELQDLDTYSDLLWAIFDAYQEALKPENSPYRQKKTKTPSESSNDSDGSSSKTPVSTAESANSSGTKTE